MSLDDVLEGGGGNDTLSGGRGDDIYRFELHDGADTIEEVAEVASSNQLRIDAEYSFYGIQLTQVAGTDDVLVSIISTATSGDSITLKDQLAGRGVDEIHLPDGTTLRRSDIETEVGFNSNSIQAPLNGGDMVSAFASSDAEEFVMPMMFNPGMRDHDIPPEVSIY
nr:hypothetical protein [Pacificimonas pallii]